VGSEAGCAGRCCQEALQLTQQILAWVGDWSHSAPYHIVINHELGKLSVLEFIINS
jgi:hypothetical protein